MLVLMLTRRIVQSAALDANARLILGLGCDSLRRKLSGTTVCVIVRDKNNRFNPALFTFIPSCHLLLQNCDYTR